MLLKMPSDGVGAVVLAGVFKVLSDFEDGFDCALWYLSGVGVRGAGSVVVVLGSHLLDSGGVVRGSSGC